MCVDLGGCVDAQADASLALDLQKLRHDHLHESPRVSQILLDCPIIVDMIEEMMLSRLHLAPDDEKWFADAQDFLSCALSGSLETLMNVRRGQNLKIGFLLKVEIALLPSACGVSQKANPTDSLRICNQMTHVGTRLYFVRLVIF